MDIWFVFVIIFVGILLWLFTFLYDLWSPVMSHTVPTMELFINDTVNSTNSSSHDITGIVTEARTSIDNVRNVWRFWPFVLFFFLLLWVIIASQKTEPMYQSYEW